MKQYETHVILGAGGAVTRALVPELLRNRQRVQLVSRSGSAMTGAAGIAADVTDYEALRTAVPEGSAVYLLVGLPYDVRVWETTWPPIMDNVIRVCREKSALLVFFDNVYMYGLVRGPMTEQSSHNPVSRKGKVRALIADKLTNEFTSGRLDAIIARSADFYGPGAEKSGIPNVLVFQNVLRGKKAQWLGRADKPHSLTYTTDCGRALPLLVGDESAHNQVWHLPTAHPPLTGRQFAHSVAAEMGASPSCSVLSPLMVKLGGMFDRTIHELSEMLYQNMNDYLFDSSRFEDHFSFTPTSYEQGIAETVSYYRQVEERE